MSISRHDQVCVGDFGFQVIAQTGFDLTGVTSVHVRFRKPGTDTFIEKTGAVEGDATNGDISYTTLEADNLTDQSGQIAVTGRAVKTGVYDRTSYKSGKIIVVEEGGQ